MSEHKVFWLVWCPATGYTRQRHDTKESAIAEAKRLAGNQKGQEFHVLASVGRALVVDPVHWIECDHDDLIPF